ncbi:flavoprotein [Streptomyces niveiscabiei]|uniref:flavoprotein n=1 Tax=Streptomyces niveiscabiei TaxID=164115 RepID=UPI0006EB5760|nr:flavoprotein [Streptomyces niveiscabiei]
MTRTLYVISCAAPPVLHAATGIRLAHERGWDVCSVLTPSARDWLSDDTDDGLDALRELTGHPVRHAYKLPSQADVLPPADALLAAPLTLNSLTKWAGGHADTLALGLLTEGIGLGLPIVALPYINRAQAVHPAVAGAVGVLRDAGVRVLLDDGHDTGHTPHTPKHGNVAAYPWDLALDALPAAD